MAAKAKKERRKSSRIPYKTSADLKFSKSNFKDCETRDLSVSGTFVLGIKGQGKGEQCDVDLHLTGEASSLLLKMKGEVVRIEDDGVALQFLGVNLDCFYHLKNIVYVHFVNPDDIECTDRKKPRAKPVEMLEKELPKEKDYDEDEDDDDEVIGKRFRQSDDD